jgi:hypothetical protein
LGEEAEKVVEALNRKAALTDLSVLLIGREMGL